MGWVGVRGVLLDWVRAVGRLLVGWLVGVGRSRLTARLDLLSISLDALRPSVCLPTERFRRTRPTNDIRLRLLRFDLGWTC